MRYVLLLLVLVGCVGGEAPAPDALDLSTPDADVDAATTRSVDALPATACRTGQLNLRLTPQPGGCGETLAVDFSVNIVALTPEEGWGVAHEVASVEGTVRIVGAQCLVDLYRVLPEGPTSSASLVHAWVSLDETGTLLDSGASFRRVYTPTAGCLQPLTLDELHW